MRTYIGIILLQFSLLYLSSGQQQLQAQQPVNFETLIPPLYKSAVDFEDKLVQLAWLNNPENEAMKEEVYIAETEAKLRQRDWADEINLTFNVNEASFLPIDNLYFPRYNFSAGLSLGTLMDVVSPNNEAKIAKHRAKIAQARYNNRKLLIRAETLRRWAVYEESIALSKAAIQAVDDLYASYLMVTEQFKSGNADFKDYTETSVAYSDAIERKITSESTVFQAKINLEELIGVPLESVPGYAKEYETIMRKNVMDK